MTSPSQRILLLVITVFLCAGIPAQSQSLQPERRGDQIFVSAPRLHFIEGKAVEKLRNGSTVAYIMTLTAIPDRASKPFFLIREKFVVSFDLWEEKYSVVQSRPEGRSASRLTASMAEAWFLENMTVPVRSIPDRQSFVIRLECSIEEDEGKENGENHSTLTLAGLIDIFSRKGREQPARWEVSAGPFRLEDLKSVKPPR